MDESDDLSWKMNDIRGELGEEFIKKMTEKFLSGCPNIVRDEIIREIEQVREENYEPMFLELFFAINQFQLKKLQEAVEAHENAHKAGDLIEQYLSAAVAIQDGMIEYLEKTKPSKDASARASKKNADMRKCALNYYENNKGKYINKGGKDRLANVLLNEILPKEFKKPRKIPTLATVRGWLPKDGKIKKGEK